MPSVTTTALTLLRTSGRAATSRIGQQQQQQQSLVTTHRFVSTLGSDLHHRGLVNEESYIRRIEMEKKAADIQKAALRTQIESERARQILAEAARLSPAAAAENQKYLLRLEMMKRATALEHSASEAKKVNEALMREAEHSSDIVVKSAARIAAAKAAEIADHLHLAATVST
jgi:hypothetical protein